MSRRWMISALMLSIVFALPSAAYADFGFVPGTTKVTALDGEGRPATQAGSHPDSFRVQFELNQEEDGHTEGGEMRDVIVDLPPGFIGNPEAMPTCSRQQFEGNTPRCPGSSQVGMARATVFGLGEAINPIYNIEPPPGVAAQFGFSVFTWAPVQNSSVRTDDGYGLSIATPNLPVEVSAVDVTVWGTPSDESHDAERVCADGNSASVFGCPADRTKEPFLTMPTSCGLFNMTARADTKQNPGVYVPETVSLTGAGSSLAPLVGCEAVPFHPSVFSTPTISSADSPSGLGFELTLPNEGLLDPEVEHSETEPEKTEVAFPPGITVNPSAANGIGVCTQHQYEGAACPEAAKLGTLFANTPLLKEPIEGAVYLAAPHDNPFNSLLALYIVARIPDRGILVKQAGVVHADPVTGQLTSTFDHLPPIPYSSFEVKLREGPRAPLITPQTCGSYTTQVRLYPFSNPSSPVVKTAPFTISSGANGGACASSEAQLPNMPTLDAGTTAPLAGAYSPFVFKLSRADGSQRFSAVEATLPPGLTGKLAGIPYCSEAQIAAAAARSAEGEGALEAAAPSCPAASQVGVVNVGAGAGSSPYYVQAKAYLAGPYKGAPLSLAIITPAIAGPFDLGTVVVRTALYVNESTAQIRAVSDSLPTILAGIPLDVRSVSLQMNRPNFVLNPTNCEPMAVTGTATSISAQVAPLKERFQVGGCKGLGFKPNLSLALRGGTNRNQHPALKSVITYPKGEYANIARASVTLPASEFIDNAHIGSPCIRPDFAAEKCPKISVLGKAKVWTPLLDKPEEGKVYFRSNGGERELPDLVIALKGQVPLTLVGFVDAVHRKGSEVSRLRTTFASAPDAPVSRFVLELKGGKEGLLVNSGNLCKVPDKAVIKLTGQNGRVYNTEPAVANDCRKGHGRHRGHHR